MKLNYLHIKHFKSIKDVEISDIGQALILVGRNNTGKTVVLDAIRLMAGCYKPCLDDFEHNFNISVEARISITENDLRNFNKMGAVSSYKRYDLWLSEFNERIPSFKGGMLSFSVNVSRNGDIKYSDGITKNNPYIKEILPQVHYINATRDHRQIEEAIALAREDEWIRRLNKGMCAFDTTKTCTHCFECIGAINKKMPSQLNVLESARLFEYKLYCSNIKEFETTVNSFFTKNGGNGYQIHFETDFDPQEACRVKSYVYNPIRKSGHSMDQFGTGMRSIYILSLLEAYINSNDSIPSIVLMEDPEIYLHPQLQKVASEILYRLSKKNQVIYTTHAPNMLFNFTSKQIRQVMVDNESRTIIRKSRIDVILDDLGYTANDLMNVNFVFIVEGKQDKNRLPLLLNKYYSEVISEDGKPIRTAIISTNSCTNIKTYANLKYINQIYLKDNFLMIRDGDGKNHDELVDSLCRYYSDKGADGLPKVTSRNVLVLKYYSFENYFLNPSIMTKIGVVKSEEDFFRILYLKWKEYLSKLSSADNLRARTGVTIESIDDIKANFELIKTYIRGHNLFDIFYGPFRKKEKELLSRYIKLAPREEFSDILEAIDGFVYFENRKSVE